MERTPSLCLQFWEGDIEASSVFNVTSKCFSNFVAQISSVLHLSASSRQRRRQSLVAGFRSRPRSSRGVSVTNSPFLLLLNPTTVLLPRKMAASRFLAFRSAVATQSTTTNRLLRNAVATGQWHLIQPFLCCIWNLGKKWTDKWSSNYEGRWS